MTDAVYGSAWNEEYRCMVDVIGEAEARQRFTAGPWFSVAVGDGLATDLDQARQARVDGIEQPIPRFSLELEPGPSFVNTHFYDAHGSIVVIYSFDRHSTEQFFLEEITVYTYPGQPRHYGQHECLRVETLEFTTNGTARNIVDDRSQSLIQSIERKDVDLSQNWEPVPGFGDWAGLGRADRSSPA
jgi:hypothetical protein